MCGHVVPATSNAPQIGRKRRMSDDEDASPGPASIKKHRLGLVAEDTVVLEEAQMQEREDTADGVKEVTRGVQEVELVEGAKADVDVEPVATEAAAAVPLPDSPVLEAQNETSEAASLEPSTEAKEEAPRKVEESSAEPTSEGAAEAKEEKERAAEEVEASMVEEDATTSDAISKAIAEPADTTISTITEAVVSEEKAAEGVVGGAEAA